MSKAFRVGPESSGPPPDHFAALDETTAGPVARAPDQATAAPSPDEAPPQEAGAAENAGLVGEARPRIGAPARLIPPLSPLDAWIARLTGAVDGNGRLDRERLTRRQMERVRAVVGHAQANSPFYAKRLAGVDPRTIVDPADLAGLPCTTPQDVRADSLAFLCVSQDDIARVTTLPSSGTTGAPKRFFFTEDDLELTRDFFHVGMTAFVRPGQTALLLMPGERPGTVGDLLAAGLARSGAVCRSLGFLRDPEAVAAAAESEDTGCLVGTPAHVLLLARHPAGARLRGRLGGVLLSGDTATPALVAELERLLACPVHRHYGLTETGLGGAVECRAKAGCHPREADLLFEIVDPDSGRPLPDGQAGEIVFTTLTRQGMPFIRYRTGDLGRFAVGPCPCGSRLRRLEVLRGRLADQVRLTGGGQFDADDVAEALLPLRWLAAHQAVLAREGDREILEIIVHAPGLSDLPGPPDLPGLRDLPHPSALGSERPTAAGLASGQAVRDAIVQALRGIPAVDAALADGALDLRVTPRDEDWLKTEAPIKRGVRDAR